MWLVCPQQIGLTENGFCLPDGFEPVKAIASPPGLLVMCVAMFGHAPCHSDERQ